MTKKSDAIPHKKATATDVARLAGVSKWTVSRAFTAGASISDSARVEVLAAAKRLGYRPNLLARSLSQKRTHIVGVAIDQLQNPHAMLLLDEVSKQLQLRGYMALLLNITEGKHYQSIMAMADQLQVDGILFLGTILTDELITIAHDMHHIPLVQVGRNTDGQDLDMVNVDGYQAGQQIARLLLEQGYQRFGYMKGPDTPSSHLLRMDGYRDALLAAGKQLDTELIAGHYDRQRAHQTMADYLRATAASERVDAMFCENDILALGAMGALRTVGQQNAVAIVGFDDIDEASAPDWQLTSYSQGTGRLIHEALNRLIDGEASEEGEWRQGELRVRRSHLKT
ncbi:LacI family transcriptional regulator [Erwiniaceae bacterium BAC15a-03b]|uniref:LacI family transcriptional regulator n=1 Tax=Winslowiella arboricola TaxID=2978220 RepID=A0A9J6PR32_9GAMM|nr:LacI family DNA-binding transcriptional regulator [Winslowiella arboricola]MCU5774526.1 LacI family transcriptional regulator [Winslowiella arboricola]MCU5778064.1 LacI family transcriptional regulator [Winslowiella arboricola]